LRWQYQGTLILKKAAEITTEGMAQLMEFFTEDRKGRKGIM